MRHRYSIQPTTLHFSLITAIFLLFANQVSGDVVAPQKESEQWFVTNATLVKPVPISLCKPKAIGLFASQVQSCKHKEQLNAPVRVRLLESMVLKNKTFVKMQFIVDDKVLAAWARVKEKASIELDPGAELYLPLAPALREQADLLVGRWNIDHWEIFNHGDNHHLGHIEIEKEEGTNEYLGRLAVKVRHPRNSFSSLFRGINSQPYFTERTFNQKMRFSINGNLLFGNERKRRYYRLSDQMILILNDDQLEGHAALPHYNGHTRIRLTRAADNPSAVAHNGK